MVILDDGNLAVADVVAQSLFLVDSTTGEATGVISDLPGGQYLIRLPATGEPPLDPTILSVQLEGDEIVFTIRSDPDHTYQLQRSANPTTIAWADLGAPITRDGSLLEFRRKIVTTTTLDLFRVRIDPSG